MDGLHESGRQAVQNLGVGRRLVLRGGPPANDCLQFVDESIVFAASEFVIPCCHEVNPSGRQQMILFVRVLIVCIVVTCLGFQQATQAQAQVGSEQEVAQILRDGITLEKQRQWIGAIQHYEAATRIHTQNSELRRRLLISRLHYDVVRRQNDQSIQDIITRVSEVEALDLYSEVLARLEMSYVDGLQMTELLRGGTAYLEVALTEPAFLESHVPSVSRQTVENFRTSVHRLTLASRIDNRFEARKVVGQAAKAAQQEIGMEPTATIMQFVFGAVGLLDPYSSFLSSAELSEVESQIEGNFVGLGIALQPHESPLRVLDVIGGGPAEEAGLISGDSILEIGSVRCVDVGPERAADLLRGPERSNVRLLIQRADGSTFERIVARRRVEVPSVEDVELLDTSAGIGYFKISSFQKTTADELDEALWKLHHQGMQSLIIDLRGNPGGWLDAAVAVADRFISEGDIVRTRGKNGIENQNYSAKRSGTWQVPLVLLIDDQSASASEILAGAIRDNHRGTLVGETTYGKGSVQGLFHTKALNSGIRLTVSKFYSPSGMAISERGVSPNVPVSSDEANGAHFVAKPVIAPQKNLGAGATGKLDTDRVLQVALEQAKTRGLTARVPGN